MLVTIAACHPQPPITIAPTKPVFRDRDHWLVVCPFTRDRWEGGEKALRVWLDKQYGPDLPMSSMSEEYGAAAALALPRDRRSRPGLLYKVGSTSGYIVLFDMHSIQYWCIEISRQPDKVILTPVDFGGAAA